MQSPSSASAATERSRQKQAAEQQRSDLRGKLQRLRQDIQHTESARGHAADALSASELAISEANRALRELADEQRETTERLAALQKEHDNLSRLIDQRKQQLGKLAREQYETGGEDRTRLLLSGENPNRINRDLQYMGYVSQAQARLIEKLQQDLKAVAGNKEKSEEAQQELEEIAVEQREQKALLEKEKSKRTTLLAKLSDKLTVQRREAGNLQRDDQRLGLLVDRLSKLLEQQRQAALAEAKRREEARRKKAQQAQQQAATKAQRKPAAAAGKVITDPIDADENPAQRDEKIATAQAPEREQPAPGPELDGADFSALRGQLRLPVAGHTVARFGSKRGEGTNWKGLFIRVPEGTPVRAVAGGKVAYADWLRGFGNLIIVDHGGQYLSIYGNNSAVLKRPGEAVRGGEVIANAGNSGGNEFSGLYFELRHQGRAFDPKGWVGK